MQREFFTTRGYFFATVRKAFRGYDGKEHMFIEKKDGGIMVARPCLGHMQAHTPADYQSLEKSYARLRA